MSVPRRDSLTGKGMCARVRSVTMAVSDTNSLFGTTERARILRSLLLSLVLTSVLLLIEPARQIVSLNATLAAIAAGIVLGAVAAVGLDDVTVSERLSDSAQTIVVLVSIGVITIAVWLTVPRQHIGTFIQFTIAFIWALPITELLSYRFRTPHSE